MADGKNAKHTLKMLLVGDSGTVLLLLLLSPLLASASM
jgi:hypothetical protein